MKSFFAWRPLAPSKSRVPDSSGLTKWADLAAFIFLGFGIVQAVVGLDQGFLRFIPLALGLLLFGLPHGAIDHLVALGLAGKPLRLRPLVIVLSLYLLVAIAVLVLWMILPVAAAVGFLIMTIYHWGQGDLAFERLNHTSVASFRGTGADRVHWLLRGFIPIGIPFIAFPDQATEFINACVHLFAPNLAVDWNLWRGIVLAALGFLFSVDSWIHLRHIRHPLARRILIENCALCAFFFLVPPLIAIGWYFAGWHGFRHVLRLCSYGASSEATRPDTKVKLICRGQQAIPFTIIAVVMLAGLFMTLSDRVSSHFEVAALYLVMISALTLPHLIIVEWMDRREAGLSDQEG